GEVAGEGGFEDGLTHLDRERLAELLDDDAEGHGGPISRKNMGGHASESNCLIIKQYSRDDPVDCCIIKQLDRTGETRDACAATPLSIGRSLSRPNRGPAAARLCSPDV